MASCYLSSPGKNHSLHVFRKSQLVESNEIIDYKETLLLPNVYPVCLIRTNIQLNCNFSLNYMSVCPFMKILRVLWENTYNKK